MKRRARITGAKEYSHAHPRWTPARKAKFKATMRLKRAAQRKPIGRIADAVAAPPAAEKESLKALSKRIERESLLKVGILSVIEALGSEAKREIIIALVNGL